MTLMVTNGVANLYMQMRKLAQVALVFLNMRII